MKRILVAVVVLAVAATGCSKIKKVNKKVADAITMDITLEDQEMLLEKYGGQVAWTRVMLEDLTKRETPGEPKKKIAPRDTKIEIVNLTFAYSGAVTINDPKHRKIVHGLEIERPLSVEKIDEKMDEIFWFKGPMLRHVDYIREWGKKTARAVRNHEVFIGMPADAARESWGKPTIVNTSEIGDKQEEQWIYKEPGGSKYIYITEGMVVRYDE